MKILQDIKTAVKLTGEIRKARKSGAKVEIRQTRTVPMLRTSYWVWTPESCLFYGKEWESVKEAFDALPSEVQHSLTFTPGCGWSGSWADRVRFWQEQLRPVLPPKQYHEALIILAAWAAKCQRRRLGEASV